MEEGIQAKKFRYAMVNRPAGLGTISKGLCYSVEPRPLKGEAHFDMARHGVLVSDRELTGEELLSFEIGVIVDGEQMDVLAERILSGGMSDYPAEYLQSAADDASMFKRGVLLAASRIEKGVMYSIGDADRLVATVVRLLEARRSQLKG